MKNLLNSLAAFLLITNLTMAQSPSTKPVKKVVTSKITKDPKTGKVVKTITTTTTTDIVLDPGYSTATNKNTVVKKSAPVVNANPVVKKPVSNSLPNTKKPVTSAKVAKPKVVVVSPKPKVVTEKPKVVVAQKPIQPKEEENGSIFANPTDQSATNITSPIEEKPTVNTPFKTNNTTKTTEKPKQPSKVFREKEPNTKFHWGFRAGSNFATVQNIKSLTSIYSGTNSYRIGLNAGVMGNIGFGEIFSIQPELNYSQQGYTISNGNESEKLDNHAITLPILLKTSFGGEKFRFFVNAGPYFSYLMAGKRTEVANGQKIVDIINFNNEAAKEIGMSRTDFGAQAGAGIQINLGGPKLELEGRYNFGLKDPINYTGTKPSYIGDTGRNRIITGTIGLLFPLGK